MHTKVNKSIIKKTMRDILRHDGLLFDPVQDPTTGEINCTKLAEHTAYQLGLYEKDGHTIPEIVFEVAIEFDKEI